MKRKDAEYECGGKGPAGRLGLGVDRVGHLLSPFALSSFHDPVLRVRRSSGSSVGNSFKNHQKKVMIWIWRCWLRRPGKRKLTIQRLGFRPCEAEWLAVRILEFGKPAFAVGLKMQALAFGPEEHDRHAADCRLGAEFFTRQPFRPSSGATSQSPAIAVAASLVSS